MAITGVIAAVGSAAMGVMGGMNTASAAGRAGDAAQRYLAEGKAFQQDVYDDTVKNMTPWVSTGQQAVDALGGFAGLPGHGGPSGSGALASYNQFTQTPYYTFPLAQGIDTMNRQAAAKGTSLSEGQVANLGKYAGNFAAGNFKDYIGALQNLSGLGASTAGTLGQIGQDASKNMMGVAGQQGTVAANTIMGQATGQNQALGSIGGLFNQLGGLAGNFGSGFGTNATASSYGGLGNTYGAGLLSGVTGSNIGSGPPIGTETMTPYWSGMMTGASWR